MNDLYKGIQLSKDIIHEALEKFGQQLVMAWTGGVVAGLVDDGDYAFLHEAVHWGQS